MVRDRGHMVFFALDVHITRVTSSGSRHQQDSRYYAVLAGFKFTIQVRGKQSHVENPAATGDFDAMASLWQRGKVLQETNFLLYQGTRGSYGQVEKGKVSPQRSTLGPL